MSSDTRKRILQESGRWLRVGSLSLSVLGPVLSFLTKRLRAQAEADEALLKLHYDQKAVDTDRQALQEDLQNRLQAIRENISDTLTDLSTRPYSQELLKRSEALTDELKERGSKLSQLIVDRGGKFNQDLFEHGSDLSQTLLERGSQWGKGLADRSSDLSHTLVERSNDFSQNLLERSNDFSQELLKRTRRAQLEKMQQKRNFWVAFGFGLGLTGAGIVTFFLIQRRQQERAHATDESAIELAQDEKKLPVSASVPPVQARSGRYEVEHDSDDMLVNGHGPSSYTTVKPPVIADAPTKARPFSEEHASIPKDATFIGIPSTRHYYPVTTPLERITNGISGDAAQTDVIYFATEQEARLQGFSAAEV
jgi:hypothetical protein